MRDSRRLGTLWEIPLSVASFGCYHLARAIMGQMRRAHFRRRLSPEWTTMSEILTKPLSLLAIMTTGPRWNTHAIIANCGPFTIKNSIAIDIETANRSARSWTIVIYSANTMATVCSLSRHTAGAGKWHSLVLGPGRFYAIARYYAWGDQVELPAIRIEDATIAGRQVDGREDDCLRTIVAFKSWFYVAIQYFVFHMLRHRDRLPAAFVRREYLPVGNPDTVFDFGAIEPGQALTIKCPADVLSACHLYLTFYNRASFPVCWYEVIRGTHESPVADEHGFYLLRVHPKTDHAPPAADAVRVAVTSPDGAPRTSGTA